MLGVTLRGQDDADGGVTREGRGGRPLEVPVGHGEEELGGVVGQEWEHHLSLGIPEAHVVLNDLGTVRRQHEAGVEHAPVVDAATPQLGDQRQDGRVHDAVHRLGVHVRHRRVGAHAAGVGAGVAVADALEVLRRQQRHRVRPVAEDEQRALLPHQPFLDDDGAPGLAERGAGQLGEHVGARLVQALRHQDALAGGETVGLDHPGTGQRLEIGRGGGRLESVEGGEARRRHPRRAQHLFHEGLRPLEERAVGARPQDGAALGPQGVRQARHERRLGADDVEVGLDLLHRLVIGHGDRRGHAGVARRHDDVGRARQHVGERVFAAAAPDDADPHAVAKETVCSRPGPTPTRRTGTPICSDRKDT